MNQKVLSVLEYNRISQMLVDRASSPLGREMASELKPFSDINIINREQDNTADALQRLLKKDGINFGSNKSVLRSLRSLEIEATLSITELLTLAELLNNVKRVADYGRRERDDESPDSLTEKFDALKPHTQVAEEIFRCIISEDEIASDASPALKDIRRQIGITGDKIHSTLNSMVNGSLRTYLQDAVITQRDGRYCIPVKAEYKSQVRGMIHDQSSTGSTLFIEPQAVVDLNNRIRELELEEKREIEKILADLSRLVATVADDIKLDQKIMTELDFIFAKGRLALDMKASRPIFNTSHKINIRKGRHPLLDPGKVVPIDIRLGDEFDLLVVTGPNTGGKTVSLKTVGLLTLMGQAGLHIPALDRSELAVFTKVYADIGDEQSIEQSLSTFSSHMKNIVTILKHADADSLCLFDELGAGTDPTEGAALAIAILDHLHVRGIRAMATTHYSELKLYALSKGGVENASCEFDVETLSPTYRLLIGIPGKSNAFAISRRLGLRNDIIEAAKEQISDEKESFEDVITDLENTRREVEKEREEIVQYKQKIRSLEQALERKQEKIDDARDKIIREAREQARDILREAKDVADETIRTFNKLGPDVTIKELEQARTKVRDKANKNNEGLSIKADSKPVKKVKVAEIKLGSEVMIRSMGLKGSVNSLPDAKGDMFVMCGIMRTKTNINDIVLLDEPIETGPKKKERSGVGQIKMSKSYSVRAEINLLGKTVDEAIYELDKYLDDAYLAHLPSVRIVHGKGTGALRQAVMAHLKHNKYIKSYRQGEYGEGDAGVTIAEFK
ncbi:MAG: endonuclease MutS2 [Lachnospiraceae bacterium]|nr:endonuclease MutS2 [Lachnospiraceae bacterium]